MKKAANTTTSAFLTGLFAERVRRELSVAFGSEFTFWDAEHRLLSERKPASRDPRRTSAAQRTLPLRHWGPQIVNLGEKRQFLAVHSTQTGTIVAIAVTLFPAGASPRQCIHTAQLVVEKIQAQDEIDYLRQQNEEHLVQATQDLEELTFLRSFAKHLEVTDTAGGRWSFARKILPSLRHSVCAEQLLLIGAKTTPEGQDQPTSVLLQFGEQVIPATDCLNLVRGLPPSERRQTHVENRFCVATASNPNAVRNLIVVPLLKAGHAAAWLVAINRTNSPQKPTDVRWALSQHEFGTSEASLVESAASILMTHDVNVELLRDKEQLVANVVRALVTTIEAKDNYTRGHSERVALFAQCLAKEMQLPAEHCERIYLTGLVHDVGKIGVSDAILKKPTALTAAEFEEIKRHPDEGWAIMRDLESLAYVLPGVLYHHERFDGLGYPDGLVGEDIPLDGRILAVADAYDAMTSDRAYRTGRSQEDAEAVLRDGAGTQWDPQVVDAFFRVRDKIAELRQTYRSPPRPQRKRRSADQVDGRTSDVQPNASVTVPEPTAAELEKEAARNDSAG